MKNIFIEGLMGTGKSTLLNMLKNDLPEYRAYREGGFSPVDLTWCTYTNDCEYNFICEKFKDIEDEIKRFTVVEGDNKIIAYTKILTDIEGFHKFMEQYEIYNGNKSYDVFKSIILNRYMNFKGNGNIFECAFLQNTISTMILFYQLNEDEIISFYKAAFEILREKDFILIYIDTKDIEKTLTLIKEERVDINGNECWFMPLVSYIENSPFGKANNLIGFEGVVKLLKFRREMELRIINEIVGEKAIILMSKNYDKQIENLVNSLCENKT